MIKLLILWLIQIQKKKIVLLMKLLIELITMNHNYLLNKYLSIETSDIIFINESINSFFFKAIS